MQPLIQKTSTIVQQTIDSFDQLLTIFRPRADINYVPPVWYLDLPIVNFNAEYTALYSNRYTFFHSIIPRNNTPADISMFFRIANKSYEKESDKVLEHFGMTRANVNLVPVRSTPSLNAQVFAINYNKHYSQKVMDILEDMFNSEKIILSKTRYAKKGFFIDPARIPSDYSEYHDLIMEKLSIDDMMNIAFDAVESYRNRSTLLNSVISRKSYDIATLNSRLNVSQTALSERNGTIQSLNQQLNQYRNGAATVMPAPPKPVDRTAIATSALHWA